MHVPRNEHIRRQIDARVREILARPVVVETCTGCFEPIDVPRHARGQLRSKCDRCRRERKSAYDAALYLRRRMVARPA